MGPAKFSLLIPIVALLIAVTSAVIGVIGIVRWREPGGKVMVGMGCGLLALLGLAIVAVVLFGWVAPLN